MKNRTKLKKLLIIIVSLSIVFISIFIIINIKVYNEYSKNYNIKLNNIISNLHDNYEVDINEIITILNDNNYINSYGIDINDRSILLENNELFNKSIYTNIILILLFIIIIIIIIFIYDNKKRKEINDITKYIEELNKKNYTLKIDENSEDELSILKNEIYKITILLKEDALNSKKDKLELKKSLEDISHQLKTPLTSILILLDNLIDNPDMDQETREDFIRNIKMEITNISFFIHSILNISKLDTNTVNFIENKVSIRDIIESVENKLSILCDLRNIKIITTYKKEPQIICDFNWQVEAFSNIIKNCIEHSNDNSIINIEVDDNKVYSQVTIRDNGKGIDKKDLPHIFERFYKGKNSNNDSCGIGLSLAKSILEKSKGYISVESELEKGSTFIIKYLK